MNVPNFLTLLRIILVPAIVIFLMQGAFCKALFLFIISGITDAMDGFLSRLLNQQTVLGAYLDPIADKALLASCFLALSILGIIPGWVTVIVISRDFIILLGISILFMMSVSFEIRPAFVGKLTTTIQLATILVVLAHQCLSGGFDDVWVMYSYVLTAGFTVISGFIYIVRGLKFINHNA